MGGGGGGGGKGESAWGSPRESPLKEQLQYNVL